MNLKFVEGQTSCDKSNIDVYVAKTDATSGLICLRTAANQEKECGQAGACCTVGKLRDETPVSPTPSPVPPSNSSSDSPPAPVPVDPVPVPAPQQNLTKGFAIGIAGIQEQSSCNFRADFNVALPSAGLAAIGLPSSFVPPQCFQCISVKGPNGKSIIAMVASTFQGAANDLQLSQSHYNEIATDAAGVLNFYAPIEWSYVSCPK